MLEVFRSNNPEVRPELDSILDSYGGTLLELITSNITENTGTKVGRRLSGGYIPGGLDVISIQHCLLIYR